MTEAATARREGEALLGGEVGRRDPLRGAALLARAAALGDAPAALRCAVLAAAGVCRPQSWSEALDHLQAAATAGSEPAQAQLRLLASEDRGTGGDDWAQMRARIDPAALLAIPERRVLTESPRVREFRGFAPPSWCRWLIDRAAPCLKPAAVYDASSGAASQVASRTCHEADFDILAVDLPMVVLRARIAAAAGVPVPVLELTKILHYRPGQQFQPHFDFFDPAIPGYADELATRGQRIATFLLYLNEGYEAGETEFPSAGLRYRGRPGDGLLFANLDRSGQVDRDSLHAGRPPSGGDKWLLSQWIRNRSPAGA